MASHELTGTLQTKAGLLSAKLPPTLYISSTCPNGPLSRDRFAQRRSVGRNRLPPTNGYWTRTYHHNNKGLSTFATPDRIRRDNPIRIDTVLQIRTSMRMNGWRDGIER